MHLRRDRLLSAAGGGGHGEVNNPSGLALGLILGLILGLLISLLLLMHLHRITIKNEGAGEWAAGDLPSLTADQKSRERVDEAEFNGSK